jgi:formylglycine-generating enzyme required for sulfatase activity
MGSVYLASDTVLRRQIALKVIDRTENGRERVHRSRVLREARAAAVEHERIARVYDVGEQEGALFVAMEFVRGQTLRAWMQGRDVTPEEAAGIGLQICEGLAVLHEHGVVHRDLKPENIMLSPSGVKLLDFGLAKGMHDEDLRSSVNVLAAGADATTQGLLCGTLGYMAPEQCRGEAVDARTDIFALGVILYELIEQSRPFKGANALEVIEATLHTGPALASPKWERAPVLREVVARAIARGPAERWPSASSIVARLTVAPFSLPRSLVPLEVSNEIGDSTTMNAFGPPQGRKAGRLRPWIPPAAAALAVALVGGLVAIRGRGGHANFGPAPLGMALIDEGALTVGQPAEAVASQCAELGSRCNPHLMGYQVPAFRTTVAPFYLDVREVTNREMAAALNSIRTSLTVRLDEDNKYRRYVRFNEGLGKYDGYLLDLEPTLGGIEYVDEAYRARPGREEWPVTQTTWFGARLYCATIGKRLPSENEWEAAARGSADRPFPWGVQAPRCGAVVIPSDGFVKMDPGCPTLNAPSNVQSAAEDVTPQGVFDLGGNVSEWVDTGYVEGNRARVAPASEADAPRVIRGGSFHFSLLARTSARNKRPPSYEAWDVGFRCALAATP